MRKMRSSWTVWRSRCRFTGRIDMNKIRYETGKIDKTAYIGDFVEIDARHIEVGRNARIGADEGDQVDTNVKTLIKGDRIVIGEGSVIQKGVVINCKGFTLGKDSIIKARSVIRSVDITLGEDAKINEFSIMEGRKISIGKHLWFGPRATIGGGSCFEVQSSMEAGDYCHFGEYSFVNTARPVKIGNEVGLGIRTCIFTHGAYLSALDGFPAKFAPVSIGDRCWIPNAIINSGVNIGSDCVISVGSIVSRNIPPSSLAHGNPIKIIANSYPRKLKEPEREKFITEFLENFGTICSDKHLVKIDGKKLTIDGNILVAFENSELEMQKYAKEHRRCIIISQRPGDIKSKTATLIDLENLLID